MPRPKVTLNSQGVVELLNDPGVVTYLKSLAGRIQGAAGVGDIRSLRRTGRNARTVVRVVDSTAGAISREARTGNLAKSIDAAR